MTPPATNSTQYPELPHPVTGHERQVPRPDDNHTGGIEEQLLEQLLGDKTARNEHG
jgi:hypothetical protein